MSSDPQEVSQERTADVSAIFEVMMFMRNLKLRNGVKAQLVGKGDRSH